MVPATLEEWTIEQVINLLQRGLFETDNFDFKETLPDSRNIQEKDRLVKICAAFANSSGGFVVFGVNNDRSLPAPQRLVGMSPARDFPEHFGNFPSQCSPSVEWEFRNPPLQLPSGQVLHVVYIPRSWRVPHACGGPEQGWVFPKRTNKGNEFMSYSEVQSMFLGFYEKRLKLQLLIAELKQIAADAQGMIVPPQQNDGRSFALQTIDLRVLEAVIADTYSITHASPDLLQIMSELRSISRMVNNKIAIFYGEVALPLSNKEDIVKGHNDFLRSRCTQIAALAERAVSLLNELLS